MIGWKKAILTDKSDTLVKKRVQEEWELKAEAKNLKKGTAEILEWSVKIFMNILSTEESLQVCIC